MITFSQDKVGNKPADQLDGVFQFVLVIPFQIFSTDNVANPDVIGHGDEGFNNTWYW